MYNQVNERIYLLDRLRDKILTSCFGIFDWLPGPVCGKILP